MEEEKQKMSLNYNTTNSPFYNRYQNLSVDFKSVKDEDEQFIQRMKKQYLEEPTYTTINKEQQIVLSPSSSL